MLYEQEITEISDSVWQSILGLPVSRVDKGESKHPEDAHWIATVQITGDWEGGVTFECQTDLASKVAQMMFGVPEDGVSIQDMQDAVGEITNMIGGNIKSLFPGNCALSLPTVAEGKDYTLVVRGTSKVSELVFETDGEPFGITLFQRQEVPVEVSK